MKLARWMIAAILIVSVSCRRHTLTLKNDHRTSILCTNFGFLKGGYLAVSIEHIDADLHDIFFTLDRSGGSDIASIVESKQGKCFRGEPPQFLYFSFNPSEKLLCIHNQDVNLQGLIFEASLPHVESESGAQLSSTTLSDAIQRTLDALSFEPIYNAKIAAKLNALLESKLSSRITGPPFEQSVVLSLLRNLADQLPAETLRSQSDSNQSTKQPDLPEHQSEIDVLKTIHQWTNPLGSLRAIPYNVKNRTKVSFTVRFPSSVEEGAYNFYVHHCPVTTAIAAGRTFMNLTLKMFEKNPDSFLSAGQEPLPILYLVMCCVYFVTCLIWFLYLRISRNSKFKIHYMMFTVILVKSISLGFQAINYYVIGKHGVHEEGWAVMFYITHIIRGVLLFATILLIGAGWTFIKHMLTPREQSLFMVVIPLQILANIATAILEESETGATQYTLWKDLFILVDLACCCAILFPVMWSIRHLQAAAHTDGKAAVNLRNLRLFPHFYIMVIGYVYSTRVIAYLFSITVSYSLTWVIELFKESVTFLFFVAVGYKFRPVDDNPYLLVSSEGDEDEDTVMERIQLEDVWSQSTVADGVTRLSRSWNQTKGKSRTDGKPNTSFTDNAVVNGQLGSYPETNL